MNNEIEIEILDKVNEVYEVEDVADNTDELFEEVEELATAEEIAAFEEKMGFACNPHKDSDKCCVSREKKVEIRGCEQSENAKLSTQIECTGRILSTKITLKDVCKGKKVAVAVLVFEKFHFRYGKKEKVYFKPTATKFATVCIPKDKWDGHKDCPCKDKFTLEPICFALPDRKSDDFCEKRTFCIKVIVNYLDLDVDSIPGSCKPHHDCKEKKDPCK